MLSCSACFAWGCAAFLHSARHVYEMRIMLREEQLCWRKSSLIRGLRQGDCDATLLQLSHRETRSECMRSCPLARCVAHPFSFARWRFDGFTGWNSEFRKSKYIVYMLKLYMDPSVSGQRITISTSCAYFALSYTQPLRPPSFFLAPASEYTPWVTRLDHSGLPALPLSALASSSSPLNLAK